MYTTFVVFPDEVTVAEDDDFIRIFCHHPVQRRETRRWLEQWLQRTRTMRDPHRDPSDLEGYDEVLRKLLEPLPDDYLRTLAPATQAILRARIGRPA